MEIIRKYLSFELNYVKSESGYMWELKNNAEPKGPFYRSHLSGIQDVIEDLITIQMVSLSKLKTAEKKLIDMETVSIERMNQELKEIPKDK